MTKTHFTPGPWFVNYPENPIIRAWDGPEGDAFDLCTFDADETGNAAANARLIAAAPDLYHALTELSDWVKYIMEETDHHDDDEDGRAALLIALETLNKAKGT